MFIDSFTNAVGQEVTDSHGRVYKFEFSERFGPFLVDDEGEPTNKVPPRTFWKPFKKWHEQYILDKGIARSKPDVDAIIANLQHNAKEAQ